MNIALIGNHYFGLILVKQLNNYDLNNNYKFYNTNESTIDKIKFVLSLPFIDIVYALGATIRGGGALNMALKFNKKIVQHFMGSDVLSAQIDFKNKNVNKKLMDNCKYLCEVSWIKNELQEIGILSDIKVFMVNENFIKPKKFKKFSVLTYMGEGKETFYGLEYFIKLANDFPSIEFKIAGIETYDNLPSNIICLGWIDMINALQNSTVFIRNAKHDGLGFSVIEALSLGRIVFRNYDFPYVQYFGNYENLRVIMVDTIHKFNEGCLEIDFESVHYVKEKFNEKKVLKELIKVFDEL